MRKPNIMSYLVFAVCITTMLSTISCSSKSEVNLDKAAARAKEAKALDASVSTETINFSAEISESDAQNSIIVETFEKIVVVQNEGNDAPQADFDSLASAIKKSKDTTVRVEATYTKLTQEEKKLIEAYKDISKYVEKAGQKESTAWFKKFVELTKKINDKKVEYCNKDISRNAKSLEACKQADQYYEQSYAALLKSNNADQATEEAAVNEFNSALEKFNAYGTTYDAEKKPDEDVLTKLDSEISALEIQRTMLVRKAKQDNALGNKEAVIKIAINV